MKPRAILLLLCFAVLRSTPAQADGDTIGYVKTLAGGATLTPAGESVARPVSIAMAVHRQDRVETGPSGEIGITFQDDTRITLGPNSRVDFARFVFKPAEKEYGFVLRLGYGTLQYLSGLTAKLAPDAMSIETPAVTIAVRGTRLLIRAEKQP
ncbi:MAG TPA: FecR domain-containing protein [Stellaceae bacterium]|nr:FecR domain-containing protein [Stellaceae bacterium]